VANFTRILAIDSETTGVCIGQDDPLYRPSTGERHQALSWGLLVVDADTLTVLDKEYIEVKWNEESKRQRREDPNFGLFAEGVHGLTFDYLEENGIEEAEAVEEIGSIILSNWGDTSPLTMLGHNIQFDKRFLQEMMERHGINLRFSARQIDSFSVGFINWRAFNSDELFAIASDDGPRDSHSAIEDIELTLESMRLTRTLFEEYVNG